MIVKELIEALSELDPDAIVIVSRDEEGNGFKELAQTDYSDYYVDHDEISVMHPDDLAYYQQDDDPDFPEDDWLNHHEIKKGVVLWP